MGLSWQGEPARHLENDDLLDDDVQSDVKAITDFRPDYRRSWHQKYRYGWRAGALLSCTIAATVLLINTTVLIWTVSNFSIVDGIGTLYGGSCSKAKSLNTWLQLLINVLCTLLLGASNYCMQCLTSPTRREVDEAHAKKRLLRIGVPSVRNLKVISRGRVFLWLNLGLSALPLHLLYNSTVFVTLQANAYTVLAGPPGFLDPGFNVSEFYQMGDSRDATTNSYRYEGPNNLTDLAQNLRTRLQGSTVFEQLNVTQCIQAYSNQYVSAWGDLFLEFDPPVYSLASQSGNITSIDDSFQSCIQNTSCIQDQITEWTIWDNTAMRWRRMSQAEKPSYSNLKSFLDTLHLDRYPFDEHRNSFEIFNSPSFLALSSPMSNPSYDWQCGQKISQCWDDNIPVSVAHSTYWKPFGGKVLGCRAEKVPERCTLNFNLSIALIVIGCNLTKVISMFLTCWHHKTPALITIGDTINSFLARPDETTAGLSLFSAASMYLHWEWRDGGFENSLQWRKLKQRSLASLKSPTYQPERWFWGQSASVMRWVMCFILFLPTLLAGISFIIQSATSAQTPTFALFPPAGRNLLPLKLPLFATALIANLPQVLISYIYITFNNLFTCMLAGREWMQFATRRQPLRVTSPRGQQRCTCWLQLPYHYSIPLLILSSILSWLASQSLFVIRVAVRDDGHILPPNSTILTCGYSPVAIVFTMVVGGVIAIATVATGLRRYPTGMPLSATCSGAISAACHPPADDVDAAIQPVQWGVVSMEDGVGHCSSSSKVVAPPIPGQRYD